MPARRRPAPPTYYVHPERSSAGCDGWSPQFARAPRDGGATPIAIGGSGWADLSELVPFGAQIEEVAIDSPIDDMSHLSKLPRLQELYLGRDTQLKNIDISQLRRLETLRLAQKESCEETIASASRVKALYIQNCGLRDLAALRSLRALNYLNVGEAPLQSLKAIDALRALRQLVLSQVPLRTLEGMEHATKLDDLYLYATPRLSSVAPVAETKALRKLSIISARQLRDLNALVSLTRLEELHLEGVVMPTSLDFLSELRRLRVLTLKVAGKVPSLHFTEPLKRLERLVLGEKVSVEDGDLSILLRLPALQVAAFRDRSHYSHRRKEIDAALADRRS